MVRVTILMLVVLVTFSSIFDLDIVLGAFAAGFILRFIVPEGNKSLETKLDAIAYGFLIPLFFVVSGCRIDLHAVAEMPGQLLFFIVALILVRCVPIVVSLAVRKDTRNELTWHNRLSVAFYWTTALPLIVAITGITVERGIMEERIASVLVAAGAVTVFLMPFLASATYHVTDADPIDAIKEIAHDPEHIRDIIREHVEREHERAEEYRREAASRIKKRMDREKDRSEG
jgi:Kef-type K+ transport system membrane component KefB